MNASIECVISVPLPGWMTDWPRGLRPARVFLEGRRLVLLYLHPRGEWVRVRLALGPRGVEARVVGAGPGEEGAITPLAVSRLLRALERRTAAELGDALGWLARALSALPPLTDAEQPSREAWARVAHLDAPGCDEARRVLRARHDPIGALAAFDPEPERGAELAPAALACRAFLTSLAGLNLVAIAQAERAAELAKGPDEREAIAELLLALGRPEPALVCLQRARLEGDVPPMRLAHAAGAARDASLAADAVEALISGDHSDDTLEQALDALREAGGHERAIELIRKRLAARASPRLFGRLAELSLA